LLNYLLFVPRNSETPGTVETLLSQKIAFLILKMALLDHFYVDFIIKNALFRLKNPLKTLFFAQFSSKNMRF